MREWRENNKGLQSAYYRAYNLNKLKRVPVWSEVEAIREFYANRPDGYEVDHIIPLFGKLVSGLHVLSNLQYLTESENSKKSNKFDIEEFNK
ncbi:MAG: HNH endonuclease signature motif containing protein, partial [Pseudomonadota bacterium]